MFPLLLLSESAQKLTWQESAFTNDVHLLKAADQLEKATSKVQNENTHRHVWRLTTTNAFMQVLSFLSQVSLAELLWQFFLLPPHPPPPHRSLSLHCLWNWWSTMIKMLGDKWRASVLEFWFVRLEGATQRTNDDSSHCSSLYHYHPLSTFSFQSSHMCGVSLLCTWYCTWEKGKRELVYHNVIHACRRFKLRPHRLC